MKKIKIISIKPISNNKKRKLFFKKFFRFIVKWINDNDEENNDIIEIENLQQINNLNNIINIKNIIDSNPLYFQNLNYDDFEPFIYEDIRYSTQDWLIIGTVFITLSYFTNPN